MVLAEPMALRPAGAPRSVPSKGRGRSAAGGRGSLATHLERGPRLEAETSLFLEFSKHPEIPAKLHSGWSLSLYAHKHVRLQGNVGACDPLYELYNLAKVSFQSSKSGALWPMNMQR